MFEGHLCERLLGYETAHQNSPMISHTVPLAPYALSLLQMLLKNVPGWKNDQRFAENVTHFRGPVC